MNAIIEKLKSDQDLRPLFLDFLCKNMILNMTDVFAVKSADRVRIQKEFYDSYYNLAACISKEAPDEQVYSIIEEVSKFYLRGVGRVGFDQYPISG